MTPLMRTFRQMLGTLSRGEFDKKLNEQMAEAVQALEMMPGDKGKAEISINVVFNYELGRIDVACTSKLKLPDTSRFAKTPFWLHDGELSTQHPNQIDMFQPVVSQKETADSAQG